MAGPLQPRLRTAAPVAQRVARIEARHAAALAELKLEIRDGITAIRTDLRGLSDRVDRQSDGAAKPRP
ncbi:MAG: hypothetical protein VW644_10010 [Alphaproteobacteria bacterium]|jgi:hypothetical protein